MKESYVSLASVHHVAFVALMAFAAAATPLTSLADESSQAASQQESWVLLRNGNVLCGQVAKIGSTVTITRSDQSKINLPGNQVETVGRSLSQLYQYRRGNRFQGDLKRLHADVRWCLRNGLLQEAAQDALEARALDPADPNTVQLLRQIAAVIRQQSAPSQVDAATPAVQTVSHESPIADDRMMADETDAAPPNGLPEKLVYEFTARIQPILMNRCTSCHARDGRNEREFQIHTALTSRWAPKDVARENLQAVMKYVDQAAPGNSLIRLRASDGHGGRRHSFGNEGSAMMANLDRWLMQVGSSQMALDPGLSLWERETDRASENKSLAPTSPPELSSIGQSGDLAVDTAHATVAGVILPGSGDSVSAWNADSPAALPEKPSPETTPRMRRMPKVENPFDPAIFNRRVHGR
ncbi:hypothetical protein [Stieleria mannarensis]|uniref:hypothetical protein n=1 Tax=Stieleria mannarensis TaxID=2755585 RepID=UPI0016026A04|nr:hypothetical protein [Rhodopirellula sp. JC639]